MSSGRKSKYIPLSEYEERKRELRRCRNRQAAEKCKKKRLEIEEKLINEVALLQNEHVSLLNEQENLKRLKLNLQMRLQNHNCINSTMYAYQQPQYHQIIVNDNFNQYNELFTS